MPPGTSANPSSISQVRGFQERRFRPMSGTWTRPWKASQTASCHFPFKNSERTCPATVRSTTSSWMSETLHPRDARVNFCITSCARIWCSAPGPMWASIARVGVLGPFEACSGYILIYSSSGIFLVCFIFLIYIDYVMFSALLSRKQSQFINAAACSTRVT